MISGETKGGKSEGEGRDKEIKKDGCGGAQK